MSPPDRRAVLTGLVASLGGPALAAIVPDDPRLKTATVRQTVSPGRTLAMYLAVPARARGRHPAMLVVHDAAGLDEPAREAAREVALLGFVACAPDFLTRLSGTPADARAARIMMARLDTTEALHDATGALSWLARNPPGERVLTGKVGALGLGWGGTLVERLAVAAPDEIGAAITVGAPEAAVLADSLPWLRLKTADEPAWARAGPFLKEHFR